MNEKYSVGDKAITTIKWDNGMGTTIPRGSVVEIISYNGNRLGDNIYACLYNGERYIYEEGWLEEVQNQPQIGGWIPCSERLPEDGVDVLVWYEYFRYEEYNRLFQTKGISFTHNGKWSGFVNGQSGWNQLSIIAWQPMPEDYHE